MLDEVGAGDFEPVSPVELVGASAPAIRVQLDRHAAFALRVGNRRIEESGADAARSDRLVDDERIDGGDHRAPVELPAHRQGEEADNGGVPHGHVHDSRRSGPKVLLNRSPVAPIAELAKEPDGVFAVGTVGSPNYHGARCSGGFSHRMSGHVAKPCLLRPRRDRAAFPAVAVRRANPSRLPRHEWSTL